MASVATYSDTTIVGENEEQLVTMIVDDQLFGIPILQVQDIVEASNVTPVPLAPSAVAGVLNLRGRIVTVIDLRKLLGNNEEVPWKSQMGVTVEYKGDLYTILVDAIGDVRTLPKRDFDKAPSTLEDNVRSLCSGIYRLRGNLLVVLDVSRILLPEAIEATPMLSVEDRRARKDAAVAANDDAKSENGRRLAALMTDLNAYESDFDSGLESLSGDDDDIKARKKANRDRRPVGERWQEVLDEKARREGATVYRMREPEEETLEDAREDAKEEDANWEAEIEARQTGTYQSRLSGPEDTAEDADRAADLFDSDQPAPVDEAAPTGSDADEPAPVEAGPDSPSGKSSLVSNWWSKMRGGSDGDAGEPAADAGAEMPIDDEPPVIDELPLADAPAVIDEPDVPETQAKIDEPPMANEPMMADEPIVADDPTVADDPMAADALAIPEGPVEVDEPAPVEEAAETPPAKAPKKAKSGAAGKKARKGSSTKPKAKASGKARKTK